MTGMFLALLGGKVQIVTDPYYEYTTLLLPGNGTNGAQNNTFLDASTNNFTITRNGNTTQGTFSPFSQTGWGNYFNGTNAYLTFATNAAFNLGTADFTIEWNFYYSETPPAGGGYDYLFGMGPNTTTGIALYIQGGVPKVWNGSLVLTSSQSVVGFTWYHLALVRSSGTLTMYLNGTSVGSVSLTSNLTGGELSSGPSIGTWSPVDLSYFPGYISNLRIVKGTAIVPPSGGPTSPLTAVSGTSLLTCQSNRFRDASSNNFAATINGSPSVQAFSPFNPTSSWSATTNGGSGYFDGSGDSLTVPSGSSVSGTGNFTVEFFIYPSTIASGYKVVYINETSGGFAVLLNSTGTLSYGRALVAVDGTTTGTVTFNQWNHVAFVRSGTGANQFVCYINGSSAGSFTNSTSYASGIVRIGTDAGGVSFPFAGYLSSVRSATVAVYTGAFTPPIAPLSTSGSASASAYSSTTNVNTSFASSETSLLLNFTNAGIYDATSKNDLETVGNAQISTAISAKWGSGSMYFPGTSSDFLKIPASRFFNQLYSTSQSFVLEFWIYQTAYGNPSTPLCCGIVNAAQGWRLDIDNTGTIRWVSNGANTAATSSVSLNVWTYFAFVWDGSKIYVYKNGSLANAGGTTTSWTNTSDNLNIGKAGISGFEFPFTGYLNDVRLTVGTNRSYTGSSITTPTAAFPTL